MSIAHELPLPPGSGLSRRQLIILLLALAVLSVVVPFSRAWALILYQLLIDGPLLLAWIGACWGVGSFAWNACRYAPAATGEPSASTLSAVTQIAVGIGLLGLAVLLLGSLGVFGQGAAIALILAGNISSVARLHAQQARISDWLRGRAGSAGLVLALAMPIVATMFVGALVMPSVLWGDEPHGYDVIEYHLQLPREWLETGRITATPHNVFGYFPLLVEMHYLLAMALHGGATGGMYLAQLVHAAMAVLTLAAIYGATRADDAERSQLRAAVAALFAAAFPWVLMLGSVAYNECGVMFFTTLALAWTLRRRFLLAGVLAGFAAGCKITAVPTLVLLVPLLVLVDSFTQKRIEWRGVAWLLLGALLAFSPWMLRTGMIAQGNPVFPIAADTLGAAYFDAGMVERFDLAHAARPDQQSMSGRLAALNQQVLGEFKFGSITLSGIGVPLLLLLIIPAIALRPRDRTTWLLGAFILGNVLVWLFATHLQGRFLVPIIPAAALLVGGVRARGWPVAVVLVAVVSAPFTFSSVYTRLTGDRAQFISQPSPSFLLPEALVKLLTQTDRPVVLLGDARALLYPVPGARLHYRTVFDVPSDQPFKTAWLGASPPADAIVIVAPSELERFEKTYRHLPKMPDDWRGRPMFVTDVELKSFTPVE